MGKNKKNKKQFLLTAMLCVCLNCFADTNVINTNNSEDDYFKTMAAMQAVPPGAAAIPPATFDEKKKIIALLKKDGINTGIKINDQYKVLVGSDFDETIEIYKGGFSNQGFTEYLLISTEGSGHYDTVAGVFRLDKGKLTPLDFNATVKTNLKIDEMNQFYMHVAKPFAIIKDHKTYLRFMTIPGESYDKSQLLLCTYLWQGYDFLSVGNKAACMRNKNSPVNPM